jgi:quinol monooxygenase YgiN
LVERLQDRLKSEDRPFTLIIQIYVRPSASKQFEAAAATAAKATLAEDGCQGYEFQRDLEKPGHYALVERWRGLAALRIHLEKEHTKRLQAVFAELSTTPRTRSIFAPVGGAK